MDILMVSIVVIFLSVIIGILFDVALFKLLRLAKVVR